MAKREDLASRGCVAAVPCAVPPEELPKTGVWGAMGRARYAPRTYSKDNKTGSRSNGPTKSRSCLGAVLVALALIAAVLVGGAGTAVAASALCGGEPATIHSNATVINGTSGDDVIRGGSANQTINGHGGNDIICGMGGNDTING